MLPGRKMIPDQDSRTQHQAATVEHLGAVGSCSGGAVLEAET